MRGLFCAEFIPRLLLIKTLTEWLFSLVSRLGLEPKTY
jgi:hypothetical protein